MIGVLEKILRRIVRRGNLEIATVDGRRIVLGDGTGDPIRVRLTDKRAEMALVFDSELALGELFMDGRFVLEQGTIYDFLHLVLDQLHGQPYPFMSRQFYKLRRLFRRVAQANLASRSRKNVHHHYDLDARLYSLFLDSDRQYSCAYFEKPTETLDDAQLAKRRHITAKLLVEPGQRVLDIGCGWGGLGLYLANVAGADVTGITLSDEQFATANARAAEQGIEDRAKFRLEDYRTTEGQFDRVVSVGMFEHVGVGFYPQFFEHAARLLAPDGVMLLHSIMRTEGPGATNPWIEKYIFPGGYVPALSEVLPVIEKSGLLVTDIELLRLHYAETLKAWRERFMARRSEAVALYDERFARMWEFYLASCEASFRNGDLMVFQIQMAHRQDVVPLTRDYIAKRESALRKRENPPVPLKLAGE